MFAVYTRKRDVTRRLQELLRNEGIRAEVLTAETPPEQREAWYERQLRNGMQVCICHPKLVQTGLDLLAFPTIFFVQTRLLDLHLAAGEPAKLADRPEGTGARRILHIFGHSTGELSSADGEETARLVGNGGKAPCRRLAGHG